MTSDRESATSQLRLGVKNTHFRRLSRVYFCRIDVIYSEVNSRPSCQIPSVVVKALW